MEIETYIALSLLLYPVIILFAHGLLSILLKKISLKVFSIQLSLAISSLLSLWYFASIGYENRALLISLIGISCMVAYTFFYKGKFCFAAFYARTRFVISELGLDNAYSSKGLIFLSLLSPWLLASLGLLSDNTSRMCMLLAGLILSLPMIICYINLKLIWASDDFGNESKLENQIHIYESMEEKDLLDKMIKEIADNNEIRVKKKSL